jgi:hypothetical protein
VLVQKFRWLSPGKRVVAFTRSAADSGVPKLAAGTRYLKEQLATGGAKVLPSQDCLKDFVLDAIAATARSQEQGESYIACLRRHLESRARFILLWLSSEAAIREAAWQDLIGIARKHRLARAQSSAGKSAGS